jgi:hypothetical protein
VAAGVQRNFIVAWSQRAVHFEHEQTALFQARRTQDAVDHPEFQQNSHSNILHWQRVENKISPARVLVKLKDGARSTHRSRSEPQVPQRRISANDEKPVQLNKFK